MDSRRLEVVVDVLPLFGSMYPELSGANGRARLVVLAAEIGGRWSGSRQFRESVGQGQSRSWATLAKPTLAKRLWNTRHESATNFLRWRVVSKSFSAQIEGFHHQATSQVDP